MAKQGDNTLFEIGDQTAAQAIMTLLSKRGIKVEFAVTPSGTTVFSAPTEDLKMISAEPWNCKED